MGQKRLHVCLFATLMSVSFVGCSSSGPEDAKRSPVGHQSKPVEKRSSEELAWESNSEKGEVAFVRHWFDEFRVAANSGNASSLRSISLPGCEACVNYAKKAEGLHAGAGKFKMSKISVPFIVKAPTKSGYRGKYIVRLTGRIEDKTSVSGERTRTRVKPESYELTAEWREGEWGMAYLNLLGSSND